MSNLAPVLVGGEALLDFISTEIGSGLGGSRLSAVLVRLAGKSIANLAVIGSDELVSLMHFANAAAAIVATRVGAARKQIRRDKKWNSF